MSIRNPMSFAVAFIPLVLQPLAAAALALPVPPTAAASIPLVFLFVIVPLADWAIG